MPGLSTPKASPPDTLRFHLMVYLLCLLTGISGGWAVWGRPTKELPAQQKRRRRNGKSCFPNTRTRTRCRWLLPFRKASLPRKRNPDSLKVSSEAIDYLDLTPAQVTEVNRALETFTKDFFKQELSRAFVEVRANGDEEIVVPGFDRRGIHAALRSDVAKWAGPDLASSIADLISHDAELGAVNTELRVGIRKGSDGRDRLIYTRGVLESDAYDPDVPINRYFTDGARPDVPVKFSSTAKVRTEALLSATSKPRVKFLFDAVGTLPKQSK